MSHLSVGFVSHVRTTRGPRGKRAAVREDSAIVGARSPRSANYACSQVRIDTGKVNFDPPE
jgi:hypothetical protein